MFYSQMTIKHLVLSGGGPAGFVTYGALRELHKHGFWDISNIKSIYGTSVGAFFGVVIALGYDWETLDKYFIKRPWDRLASVTPQMLIDSMNTRGLFSKEVVEAALEPLLTAKGLSCDTTLAELYNFSGIEIVAYTANVNAPTLDRVELSHKTYPDLPITTAMAMTMAVPVLFQPVLYEGGCYVDGGCVANMPVNDCLEGQQCPEEEIFALRFIWDGDCEIGIDESSSLTDYLMALLRKAQLALCSEHQQKRLPNWLESVMVECNGIHKWMDALGDESMRVGLIEQGQKDATKFLVEKGIIEKEQLEGNVQELA